MKKQVLWWLGFIWALPVTLGGLLLALVASVHVTTSRDAQGVLLFHPRDWFAEKFFKRFHVGAFMWGACLFAGPYGLDAKTVAHELVHFKQARIFGIFLPIAYGIGALVALAQGKRAYYDCFLEVQARRESGH